MYLLNAQTRRRKDRRLEREAEGESVDADPLKTAERSAEDLSDQEGPETSKHKLVKRKAVSRIIDSEDEEDVYESDVSRQEKQVTQYIHLLSVHWLLSQHEGTEQSKEASPLKKTQAKVSEYRTLTTLMHFLEAQGQRGHGPATAAQKSTLLYVL